MRWVAMRFHRRVPSTSRSETAGIPHLFHGRHASLPQSDGRLQQLDQARASLQDSQQRLNINGVIDCNELSAIVRYDDTINAQSTIKLFQQIELQNPGARRIHIICDNARYYHARLVKDYLANSRIELVFLPPYAPNLNLIERFWKFFKKTVLYGRYYETFSQFKTACDNFFAGLDWTSTTLRYARY